MSKKLFLALFLSITTFLMAGDRVYMLDGKVLKSQIAAIKDGVLHLPQEGPALMELREIKRDVKEVPYKTVATVYLVGGGIIRAQQISLKKQQLETITPFGKIKWPLKIVHGVSFADPPPEDLLEASKEDRLFAVNPKGKTVVVNGALVEISDKDVTFLWNEKERKVARNKVQAIGMSTTASEFDRMGLCRILLQSGTSLWVRNISLNNDKLSAEIPNGPNLKVDWDRVMGIQVASDRVVFLSDIKPIEVYQRALLTFKGPWRNDLNVMGTALTLDRVYSKGLGTHADCRLKYAIPERFNTFSAVIGIDKATKGKGDCVFRVLVDDIERYSQRVRGTDRPRKINIPLKGGKTITLIAEAGEDFDISDHANWCDARLIVKGAK